MSLMQSVGECSSGISIVCNGNTCVIPKTSHVSGNLPEKSPGSGNGGKPAYRKKRTVSVDQKEIIISALETWNSFPDDEINIRNSLANKNAWKDLSSTLNQMENQGENKRTPREWKKVWAWMKSSAKRRVERVKAHQEIPARRRIIPLTRRETRILSLTDTPRDPYINPLTITPKIEPHTPVYPVMESMDVTNIFNQEISQSFSHSGSEGSSQILDEHSYANLQGPYTERELQLFQYLASERLEVQRLQKENAFLKNVLLNNFNMLKDAIIRV